MKRSIALTMVCVFATLLLAGCNRLHNGRDMKPVSSATAVAACSEQCPA